MLRWIVFDLDDTLYEEREYVLSGFRAVARHVSEAFGLHPWEIYSELTESFDRGHRGDTFNQLTRRYGLPALLVGELVNRYRDHLPDISLRHGMKRFLLDLKREYRLGLITDGYHNVQRLKVIALDLESVFNRIIFTDLYGRDKWKPNPYVFRIFRETLGFGEGEALYIGDNPAKDFHPASVSGYRTMRIEWPGGLYGESAYLNGCEPDYTVQSLDGLRGMLETAACEAGSALRTAMLME